ncbi:hypothetical protein KEM48_001624 [Puccinia striiformis f. sp. tritici PST-130]|nr:hypothetical protein KEM48_001624 [Puccinia striiformis f. sp. tritici PST-130]
MVLSGCGRTHKVKSPDWGFGQQEVTCNQNPTLASSLWYIESNYQPLLEKEKKPLMVNYLKPSFWTKFSEVQSVMWQTNKALVQHHAYGSRPSSWPILKRGMNLSQCERARWRHTWDFSCHDFPEHVMEDYEDALMDDFMDEINGMTNSSRSNRQGSDSKLAVHNRFKLLKPIMDDHTARKPSVDKPKNPREAD